MGLYSSGARGPPLIQFRKFPTYWRVSWLRKTKAWRWLVFCAARRRSARSRSDSCSAALRSASGPVRRWVCGSLRVCARSINSQQSRPGSEGRQGTAKARAEFTAGVVAQDVGAPEPRFTPPLHRFTTSGRINRDRVRSGRLARPSSASQPVTARPRGLPKPCRHRESIPTGASPEIGLNPTLRNPPRRLRATSNAGGMRKQLTAAEPKFNYLTENITDRRRWAADWTPS